jgi:putative oxidoreductase
MNTINRKLPLVARIFLGAIFLVFGLNKFLHFIPQPPMSGRPLEFMGGMMAAGYLFPLLALTEIVAGALLIGGRFVPLAITLLAPIIVNIAGFHLALAPEGLPVVAVVLASELYLAWSYRHAFAPMLKMKAAPAESAATAPSARMLEVS